MPIHFIGKDRESYTAVCSQLEKSPTEYPMSIMIIEVYALVLRFLCSAYMPQPLGMGIAVVLFISGFCYYTEVWMNFMEAIKTAVTYIWGLRFSPKVVATVRILAVVLIMISLWYVILLTKV